MSGIMIGLIGLGGLLLIVPSLLLLGICGLVRAYDAFRFQGGEA